MKCRDCGKEMTQREIDSDKRITERVGKAYEMCESCWADYANHAMTGQ